MSTTRCIACMEEMHGIICSKCGCDNESYEIPLECLCPHTILNARYLVGKVLGQGGFGITYVGFDLLLNLKVAIKEYFPRGMVSRNHSSSNELTWNISQEARLFYEKGANSFLKEARKMAKIDNIPEIVRVRDTFLENGTAYIVMDYVEGRTLKDLLNERGTMKYEDCIRMLKPLIKALENVHKQGIIHKDISPDNIMVKPDGSVCLLDLGAAKDISKGNRVTSELVIKHGFSPPEQYMETGELGSWTDVYAMCATIYYCISGHVLPSAMDRLMKDTLFLENEIKEPLSNEIKNVMKAGLALKKEKRIQTIEDLLQKLPNENTQNLSKKKNRENKKNTKLFVGIGAVVAVIALFIIFGLGTSSTEVAKLGNSNSNHLNMGSFAILEKEYIYYRDHLSNLYVCAYDAETENFGVGDDLLVSENAYFINLGKDKVYFSTYNRETQKETICQMDFDGKNVKVLAELSNIRYLQYALMENDKEWLYYLYQAEDSVHICKMNLATQEVTTLYTGEREELAWMNLWGDSIYYIRNEEVGTSLCKNNLNGSKEEILVSDTYLQYGFIEEGTLYAYSKEEETMLKYDLEGKKLDGFYNINFAQNGVVLYADGWLYYIDEEEYQLHKIRTNGTGDTVVLTDIYPYRLSAMNGSFWLEEGLWDGENETVSLVQSYIGMGLEGELIPIASTIYETEDGWQYRLENGGAILCGYVGEKYNVAIPYVVDGYAVSELETETFSENHAYFVEELEENFEYKLNADKKVCITGYKGTATGFMIPKTIAGVEVVEIGENAFFENTSLEKIAFPDTVEIIGNSAFKDCTELKYVGLNENLKEIVVGAFQGCKSLDTIQLPESLEKIGSLAFGLVPLKELYIPSNVTSIGGAFFNSPTGELKEIQVSKDNKNFVSKDGVVYTKDFTQLVCCPNGKTGEFIVPNEVKELAVGAFIDCNKLERIVLSDAITAIQTSAFRECRSLKEIVLPSNVTIIAKDAFAYCTELESIVIPPSVKIIREQAFSYCNKLKSITVSRDCQLPQDLGTELQINYYE